MGNPGELMRRITMSPVRLDSGLPWHVSITVEQVGCDYICHLHGGDRHIGAVALSQWKDGRPNTRILTVSSHKEGGLALHSAHTLCKASRRSVACIAGLHYDAVTSKQIAQILETAAILIKLAAEQLANLRFRQGLHAPFGLYTRVTSNLGVILHEIDLFMDMPLGEIAGQWPVGEASASDLRHGVCLFAPIYLSNACSNDCAYCGFRRSAHFKRAKLRVDQALEEAWHLVGQGHRTIDLVTGEIPTDRFVDYVCVVIEQILATTGIRRINLNLGALSQEQYRRLRGSGATGYHLYQETYHPDAYFKVHRSGLKRDMVYRMEAPHRAVEAGFKFIGLGLLVGLRPLRDDLVRLIRHGQILKNDYPDVRLGFSLPRIQKVDEACDYVAAAPVSDNHFIKAMLFLKLKFPTAHLTLTTRERPEIRDMLIPLGVTKVSAGVSTAPGGYAHDDKHGKAQFFISDRRSLGEIVDMIHHAGLTVVFE